MSSREVPGPLGSMHALRDPVRPGTDVLPVTVIAMGPAQYREEEGPETPPISRLDGARKVSMITRPNGQTQPFHLARLLTHPPDEFRNLGAEEAARFTD